MRVIIELAVHLACTPTVEQLARSFVLLLLVPVRLYIYIYICAGMAWLAAVTGEAAKFSTEVVHGHYRANLEPSITIKANGKLGYTPKDFPAAFYLSVTTCSRTWFISPENFLFRNSSDISPSWERKREGFQPQSRPRFFLFSLFFCKGGKNWSDISGELKRHRELTLFKSDVEKRDG